MACSSCQARQRQLIPSQLQDMPVESMIELYRQGYKLPEKPSIKSMAFSDISSWQYLTLGILSYLSYKSYDTRHEIWAIIFGAFALGELGSVYRSYNI